MRESTSRSIVPAGFEVTPSTLYGSQFRGSTCSCNIPWRESDGTSLAKAEDRRVVRGPCFLYHEESDGRVDGLYRGLSREGVTATYMLAGRGWLHCGVGAAVGVVVSLRVRRDIVLLADEMVRYGMASSRDEAFRLLLETGVEVVRRELERRKRVEELMERFERQGGIRLGGRVNVVSELREMRG